MLLLLYGTHGRAPVHVLQSLFRTLSGSGHLSDPETVRDVVAEISDQHPFQASEWIETVLEDDDAGIADLLLNPHERTFTVPEIYELVEQRGLSIIDFLDSKAYDPMTYVANGGIREDLQRLPKISRQYAAELLNGRMRKHVLFVGDEDNARRREETERVPLRSPRYVWPDVRQAASDDLAQWEIGENPHYCAFPRTITISTAGVEILKLCDGFRTVLELSNSSEIQKLAPTQSVQTRANALSELCSSLATQNVLILRPTRIT